MKRTILTLALLAATSALHAAPWTYKGTLSDAGKPANGPYDLRITLLNEAKSASVSTPVTLYSVNVVDGSFAVDVDFGIDLTSAPVMALKTEVQQGGSGFVSLGEATRFDAKAALGSVCWDTAGNAGTTVSDFLGTTDNQPLQLRANNTPVLRIFPRPDAPNFVAGSPANTVNSAQRGQVIAGGGAAGNTCGPTLTSSCANRALDDYATVSGGFGNTASFRSTVGGGRSNTASEAQSTVGGGEFNTASGADSTVGGGQGNTASGADSTVGGGRSNTASGTESTVGGGRSNTASGAESTVGGGESNTASGASSIIAGGDDNTASGIRSVVSGGRNNCAGGNNSWVGGQFAKTRVGNEVGDGTCAPISFDATGDEGSFVWADQSSLADFISTGPNQFIVRAAGGVGINTADVQGGIELAIQALDSNATLHLRSASGNQISFTALEGTGTLSLRTPSGNSPRIEVLTIGSGTASLSAGGTWTNASSRSYKENFTAVNGLDVLSRLVALPIMTWDYIGSSEGLHMGPVAEDFKASFGLAGDGKSISTVDADGIALAAIQGLNAKLESENAALRARLDALEARSQ